MEKLYTTQEAAELLKIHPKTLKGYIDEGLLKASWFGNRWRIKSSELMRFVDESEKGGKDE
jgi:excisionase family DNA binding protein